MNSLKCIQKYIEIDAVFDWKPMKLLQSRGDVVHRRGPGDNTSSRVLDTLKLMERFLTKTKKKRVAVIDPGSDQAMNKNSSGMWGEKRTDTINVTQMEICRPSNVIDV